MEDSNLQDMKLPVKSMKPRIFVLVVAVISIIIGLVSFARLRGLATVNGVVSSAALRRLSLSTKQGRVFLLQGPYVSVLVGLGFIEPGSRVDVAMRQAEPGN